MAIEVLVMCPACGRPQPPKEQCVQCGAQLPAALTSIPPSPVKTEMRKPEEPKEIDLGGGRKLVLTAEKLELQFGPQTDAVPLSEIRRVTLVQRRVFFFAMTALLGAVFAGFVSTTAARVAVVVLAAGNLFMWFRMREFGIQIERKDGSSTLLPLGQGGKEKGRVTQAAWSTVSEGLARLGVDVPR